MYIQIAVICIVLGSIAGTDGHSFKLSSCPKVKVMKDFEMDKFVGDWFVVGRFNPLATCTKLNIEKDPEGVFNVQESSRPFGISLEHKNDQRRGRKMTILSNDTDAIFKVQQRFLSFGLKTFGVVDTDYSNYAVVWGCDPFLVGSLRNLDILSRTLDIKIDTIKELAEKVGVDVYSLEKVDHRKCQTTVEEPSVEKDGFNNMFVDQ